MTDLHGTQKSAQNLCAQTMSAPTSSAYGPRFWATYLSNLALMVAVSLLFRYADFVAAFGGSEDQLGAITGLGMIGGIAARCFLGQAIDKYGSGRVWCLSLALLAVCLLGHLWVQSLRPPTVHLLRILYTISLAGAFGSSITFVSLRVPPNRMGEMIGMLGSSGFIGMGVGPAIGDWLFRDATPITLAGKLFCWSSGAAIVSLLFACLASFGTDAVKSKVDSHTKSNVGVEYGDASWWSIVRRYHPGWTLLIGCAMGVGIGMPGTFLSAFAEGKGIDELAWFWTPYAVVAFIVRILTRKLADQWGTRPTVMLGLCCIAASMFSYLVVQQPMTLILPATLGGLAHAFLFPAAMAEGNHSFPAKYRGVATTLMLMMFDFGMLVGQPVFGWAVEASRRAGGDGYSIPFSGLATALLTVAAAYWALKRETDVPQNAFDENVVKVGRSDLCTFVRRVRSKRRSW